MQDILTDLMPLIIALVTSFITFYITKYTITKTVPLEKMEIAYNRIYYLLFRLVGGKKYKQVDHNKLLELSNNILKRYEKYLSLSTKSCLLRYVKNSNRKFDHKSYYIDYYNNIISFNAKLRARLGYPQASIFERFKSLPYSDKFLNSIGIEVIFFYIFAMIYLILQAPIVLVLIIIVSLLLIGSCLLFIFQSAIRLGNIAWDCFKARRAN